MDNYGLNTVNVTVYLLYPLPSQKLIRGTTFVSRMKWARWFLANSDFFFKNKFIHVFEIKGQFNKILTSAFFTDGLLPTLLLVINGLVEFGFEFNEIFAIFDWLSAIIYGGKSILPVTFTMESCFSLHHFSGESLFVRIICINSYLSFNTESRYSPYCLLWGVTTSRLIYSGESLLTAKSYFPKPWRTSPFF
jgi:hypothetical protein